MQQSWKTCLALLASLSCDVAGAQVFSIDWFSLDGGGGVSTGGVYAVSGTIGQADAGRMSGRNFTLEGGFWGIITAVQTPGVPRLSVTLTNGVVTVFWPLPATDWVLDQTTNLTGSPIPWAQVPFPYATNATQIFITVPAPAGNRFYRLRKL
jgi:hypothetical protein